jgi:hypothetical protein
MRGTDNAALAATALSNAIWTNAKAAFIDAAITTRSTLTTGDIDARLAAIGLDHLLGAAVIGTDIVDNSIFAKLVSSGATADWDTFNNTTDALQAIRDRGDSAWVTGNTVAPDNATIAAINAKTINLPADPASDTTVNTRMPTTHISSTLGIVDQVNVVNTTTTNTDMRGTDGANTTTPPTVVQIRTEMDTNSTKLDVATGTRASQADVTLLIAGTIKANTPGSFHTQLTDSAGDPVASQAVTVQRLLDNGVWAATAGSASNTDANGHTLLSYAAADVNGTSAVSFKFSATGARDTYLNFKLSV